LALASAAFFLLLVLELAVIHQTANRRYCGCRNFHQINVQLARHAQRFGQTHDAEWLVFDTRETNLWNHDFPIQSVFAFFALTAITKFGSDDLILYKVATTNVAITAQCFPESRQKQLK
jgi:hypothetical protein